MPDAAASAASQRHRAPDESARVSRRTRHAIRSQISCTAAHVTILQQRPRPTPARDGACRSHLSGDDGDTTTAHAGWFSWPSFSRTPDHRRLRRGRLKPPKILRAHLFGQMGQCVLVSDPPVIGSPRAGRTEKAHVQRGQGKTSLDRTDRPGAARSWNLFARCTQGPTSPGPDIAAAAGMAVQTVYTARAA